jgi:hypothetical protein
MRCVGLLKDTGKLGLRRWGDFLWGHSRLVHEFKSDLDRGTAARQARDSSSGEPIQSPQSVRTHRPQSIRDHEPNHRCYGNHEPALWWLSHLHKTKANAMRPMQPSEAPCESRLAAMRPRLRPSEPILALRFFSWLSMRVALAGKIAGNARKRPPTPGPNLLAIRPATTVAKPPNKNRTTYSCGLVSFREDKFTSILFMLVSRKVATGQVIRQTRSGGGLDLQGTHQACTALGPNRPIPRKQKNQPHPASSSDIQERHKPFRPGEW